MLARHLSTSYFFELCKKGISAVIALSRVSSSTQIMELNCWKLDSNVNSPDRVLLGMYCRKATISLAVEDMQS
jgi:hypothetical protein